MPNIAHVLKREISRVARKEIRSETAALKKAVAMHRGEIAALKRRAQALEQRLRRIDRGGAPEGASSSPGDAAPSRLRFNAKGFAAQRRRLGLSARECGLLLGASAQSIYNWEQGKARPLARHLAAIGALRTMGKREATLRLESPRG